MMRWMVVLVTLGGCVEASIVQCDFGACPSGRACDDMHDRCVLPTQLESCLGAADDTDCMAGTEPGVCVDQVCLERGCGDFRVNGSEQCDGTQFLDDANDCSGVGFYGSGPIACNSDCTVDASACSGLGFCGDGVVDSDHEACDFAADTTTTTCAALGYYSTGTAECTAFCSYKTEGVCSERCGDGVVNGPESCEPSLAFSSTCLDYGFDSGGLSCSAVCSPDLPACHQLGFNPLSFVPTNPYDLWQSSPTSAFVVGKFGSSGQLARWNGATMTLLGTATSDLISVSGTSATNVIAVGTNGAIVKYDGSSVTPMTSNTNVILWSVWAASATEAFAVGDLGTIRHLNGAAWGTMTPPSNENLFAVWGLNATDVWAGGQNAIHHYTNGSWQPTTVPSGTYVDIWGSSSSDVWAVSSTGFMIHYNGSIWESPISTAPLSSIWGADANHVLAAGPGRALHYKTATHWLQLDAGSTDLVDLRAVSGVDATHVMLVDSSAHIARWEGVAWSTSTTIDTGGGSVDSVWATSPSNVYVATPTVLHHYNGTVWTDDLAFPTASVWGRDANDVFAASSGTVYRNLNGAGWQPMTMPNGVDNVLHVTGGGTSVFGLAKTGEVISLSGTTWSTIQTLNNATSLWAAGTNDLYVGGASIQHYNGTTWTSTSFAGRAIAAIWSSSPTNLYAVGAQGLVAHSDGTTWTEVAVPTTQQLTAVYGTGPNDIFVVGTGVILHFDGSRWNPVRPAVPNLARVWPFAEEVLTLNTDRTARWLVRPCASCL